jgi:positive regulator of sigma E activity
MEERGEVIRVDDGTVEVELTPSQSCAKCAARDFCRPIGNKRVITAANPGNIITGDRVIVRMIARQSLIAVFLFFGVPVILSFIGLLIGQQYGELGSLIIGTGAFALGLIIAKILNDFLGSKRGFHPRITKTCEKTQS